jgi:lipoprotein-anchoring transpeptidase ErfK/SrfK
MAQGRHSRTMLGRAWWMGLLAVMIALLLGAGTALAAYGYDRSSMTRILPGVRVEGIAVGGMTRDQAIRVVTARADMSLAGDLTVTAAGYSWHVTPAALGTRADVDGAVDQAFAAADRLSLLSRVFHRVAGKPVHLDIRVEYAHDQAKVQAFVQQAYDEVTEPAVDAGIDLVDDQLVMRKSKPGEELKAEAASARILRAIDRQVSSVQVPVKVVQPKVTAATLGKTLVVDLSENQLYLYDGFKVDRQYPVATAAPGYSTPVGSWQVVNKAENPGWYNPDPEGWGAGLPLYIPPGPGNPLGTRAIYLSAPGIRIHGTYASDSIGTYASHGCIRMYISDSQELYPLVPVGTKVIIKP